MASGGQSIHQGSPDCECGDSYDIFMIGCSRFPNEYRLNGPMYRLDMHEREWRRVDCPIPKRFNFAVTTFGNTIWVLGGTSGVFDNILKSVIVYDPSNGSWNHETDMPHYKTGLSAVVMGRRVYAIGGQSDTADGNTVELYHNRVWQAATPLIHCRHSFATAVAENRIYAAGGMLGDAKLSSVEYYSQETGMWTELTLKMPAPRACFSLFVIGDKMYAVGGDEKSTIRSIDSMYTDGQWSTDPVHLPSYFQNRIGSVATNRDIYVVGCFFGDHETGILKKLRLGDVDTSFVAHWPSGTRFDNARLAVLKTRPCEAERARNDS